MLLRSGVLYNRNNHAVAFSSEHMMGIRVPSTAPTALNDQTHQLLPYMIRQTLQNITFTKATASFKP